MTQMIEIIERYSIPDLPTTDDLPGKDGIPLETNWHRIQINLLIEIVQQMWRGLQNFVVGGNMFVYYSLQQVRSRDYKGPDFFVVKEIDGSYSREKWVVWEENGRYPNVIVELLSPSTAEEDLGKKKDLYERIFHTSEFFCYDPGSGELWGWELQKDGYTALKPNAQEWMWSSELRAWVGIWEGEY